VFRLEHLVAKFFPPAGGWRRLGRSKARASAALHFVLAPIATPRPLLALDGVGPDRRGGLLVYEYADGRTLEALWGRDARAREALVALLGTLDERRIVHGDLHPGNLVWDGEAWTLLDLAGVRHGLHGLLRERARRRTWVRLLESLGDEQGVRDLHAAWARRRGLAAEARWRRVVGAHVPARAARARARRRERDEHGV
jgi:Ser/Thr protein kinase RdoA (MazF antagonist)